MKNNKSVAIVIATYNGDEYIREQLISILSQTYSDFNVYISDDNSSDNTLDIIKEINDPRVKIIKNKSKNGVVSNFNNGLSSTTEDVILLSDQDDIWPAERLQKMLGFYEKNSDPEKPFLMFTDMTLIDSQGAVLDDSFYHSVGINPDYNSQLSYLTWRCTAYGCSMLFNRQLLNIALPLPDENQTTMHDNWLLLCSLVNGKVSYYNYKSVLYRQHQSNHTGGGNNSFFYKIKHLRKQILTINNTQKRRLSQLKVMQDRGLLLESDIKKYNSAFKYIIADVLPFKKEKRVYKAFYCAILVVTKRFNNSVLFM